MVNVIDVAKVAAGVWAIKRSTKRRGSKLMRAAIGIAGGVLTVNGAQSLAASQGVMIGGANGGPSLTGSTYGVR